MFHFAALNDETESCQGANRRAALYRALIESSLDLITVIDEQGMILFNSSSVQRIVGYSPPELEGRNAFDLIHADDCARAKAQFDHAWRTSAPTSFVEFRVRHRDGSWHVLESVGNTLVTPDGVRVGVVTSRDITDLRALQAQFHHAQRIGTLGRFVSAIVHEFQNALQVVVGNVDRILMTNPASEMQLELNDVRKAAEAARSFSRQLLDLSRIGATPLQLLDINTAIEALRATLQGLVGSRIRVVTQIMAPNAVVLAHPGTFEQIIVNLVSNARDAMPLGGTLTISSRNVSWPEPASPSGMYQQPCVAIDVTDDGVGMPLEIQAQIFEPYFTTKGVGKGSGLGLSTVRGIMKQAGGSIEVRSVEGRGTSFSMYWPLAQEKPGGAA